MAYMNQEKKAQIAMALKPVLKKYGLKATLSVHNHSSISVNIKSGPINFGGDNIQVNHYWIDDHYKGRPDAMKALKEIKESLLVANYYDNTNAQIDYFDTAYYYHINIGKWNKPYQLTT